LIAVVMFLLDFKYPVDIYIYEMRKALKSDANTACALAVVRFGHCPPAHPPQTHRQDRLQYTVLLASASVINNTKRVDHVLWF